MADEPVTLHDRIIAAAVGSCSCMIAAPERDAHSPTCRYRVLLECYERFDTAIKLMQGVERLAVNSARPAGWAEFIRVHAESGFGE